MPFEGISKAFKRVFEGLYTGSNIRQRNGMTGSESVGGRSDERRRRRPETELAALRLRRAVRQEVKREVNYGNQQEVKQPDQA
jgi:hypothetical protein